MSNLVSVVIGGVVGVVVVIGGGGGVVGVVVVVVCCGFDQVVLCARTGCVEAARAFFLFEKLTNPFCPPKNQHPPFFSAKKQQQTFIFR